MSQEVFGRLIGFFFLRVTTFRPLGDRLVRRMGPSGNSKGCFFLPCLHAPPHLSAFSFCLPSLPHRGREEEMGVALGVRAGNRVPGGA